MAGIYGGGCLINPDEGLTDCDKAMKLHLIKDSSDDSNDDLYSDGGQCSHKSMDSAPLMSHDRKKDHQRSNRRMNTEELRMVMVGKTGNGKSATGNTILGRQCFESKLTAASVTVECSKGRGTVDGQKVAVVDTPGLFDTRYDEEKIEKGIRQCVMYAAPGPHVFLVVIRLGRFTEEEIKTVEKIQEMFGQAAERYSMVLFTHGDLLKSTIKEFLEGSQELQELVARCNGHYHVFNNKSRDRSQVTELLQKIRNMVQKNGGSHYTNETFQEAERILEEEKQQILKEKEEEIRREKENLERTLKQQFDREIAALKEQLAAEMKTLEELRFKEDQQQRASMMEKMQAEHAQALRDQQMRHEVEMEKKQKEFDRKHAKKARKKAEKMKKVRCAFM